MDSAEFLRLRTSPSARPLPINSRVSERKQFDAIIDQSISWIYTNRPNVFLTLATNSRARRGGTRALAYGQSREARFDDMQRLAERWKAWVLQGVLKDKWSVEMSTASSRKIQK
jgi:hypothetical protein